MQAVLTDVPVRSLVPVSLVLLTIGCGDGGPPSFEVRGKVTYRTQQISSGSVTFAPIGGGELIVSAISENGEYRLKAPEGKYEVAVMSIADVVDGPEGFDQKVTKPLLPDRFSIPSRSGITATVEAKDLNAIDLTIQ